MITDSTEEFKNVRVKDLFSFDQITYERVNNVVAHSPYAAMTNFIAASLIAYVILTPENQIAVLSWLTAIFCIYGFIFSRRRKTTRTDAKPRVLSARAKRRFLIFVFLSITPWIYATLFLLPNLETVGKIMMATTVFGAMAVSGMHLARIPAAALLYIVTLTLTLLTHFTLHVEDYSYTFLPLTTIFSTLLTLAILNNSFLSVDRDKSVAKLSVKMHELHSAQSKITDLASRDAVTGLPNRRRFGEELESILNWAGSDNRQVRLILIDVDHFKALNDTHGHQHGDQFLMLISHRLRNLCRIESFVSRIGGDEFAIIDWRVRTPLEQKAFHQSILHALMTPVELKNARWQSGGSLGIAYFPDHANGSEKLVSRADMALYQAKENGRGIAFEFDPALQEKERQIDLIADQISAGLTKGEFELYYQPQYAILSGEMVGMEALVRWNHEGRVKLPYEFFPAAEARGKIADICDFVMEQSGDDARWFEEQLGQAKRISINIHALQLKQPEKLVEQLGKMASKNVSPSKICLEITEGCMIGHGAENTPVMLRELRELGYRISLDDFGTGFASLSHLRDLSIDEIKIDRDFVHDILDNKTNQAIARAVSTLANDLGLELVAEGVEGFKHVNFLHKIGCEICQGYFYSKPARRQAIVKLFNPNFDLDIDAAPIAVNG